MADNRTRIEFLRGAGYVRRAHTLRIIGDYCSNEHVHNMMNMLLVLHPNPSLGLVKLIQFHDTGEFCAGDTPSPAKGHHGLGLSVNLVERDVREIFDLNVDVTEEDIRWLKSLDILEFFLFCLDQIFMGNNAVANELIAAEEGLNAMQEGGDVPRPVWNYYMEVKTMGRPMIDKIEVLRAACKPKGGVQ